MAHFPFISNTLVMLGLGKLESFSKIEHQNHLVCNLLEDDECFVAASAEGDILLSDLGTVACEMDKIKSRE